MTEIESLQNGGNSLHIDCPRRLHWIQSLWKLNIFILLFACQSKAKVCFSNFYGSGNCPHFSFSEMYNIYNHNKINILCVCFMSYLINKLTLWYYYLEWQIFHFIINGKEILSYWKKVLWLFYTFPDFIFTNIIWSNMLIMKVQMDLIMKSKL